jgi:lysozyme family protein
MADEFRRALERVLVHEGGKANHPKDPGGKTNFGVTQRVYDAYRSRSGLPLKDVFLIGSYEVETIYRTQYWNAISGDKMPPGVGYVVMDGAVHSGPGQSIKWLQRALGAVYRGKVDGVIGNLTLDAIAATTDHDALIARIIDRREVFLRALKNFKTFGKGWISRINNVERTGQAWAMGSVGPAVEYIPGGERKAVMDDAKTAPDKGMADAATGGGVASGGLGATVNQLQEQLTPYSAAGGWITNLVVSLIVLGAVLAVGGLAWRWWSTRKATQLADALDLEVMK